MLRRLKEEYSETRPISAEISNWIELDEYLEGSQNSNTTTIVTTIIIILINYHQHCHLHLHHPAETLNWIEIGWYLEDHPLYCAKELGPTQDIKRTLLVCIMWICINCFFTYLVQKKVRFHNKNLVLVRWFSASVLDDTQHVTKICWIIQGVSNLYLLIEKLNFQGNVLT